MNNIISRLNNLSRLNSAVLIAIISYSFCLQATYADTLNNIRTKPLPGTVALTFDDGPSLAYTPKILKILKSFNIKATFFVVGKSAERHPEILKAIAAAGHSVQIHSMTHPNLTKLSNQKLYYEIVGSRDVVKNILGKTPVCMRPPYGISNKRVTRYARRHQIIVVPLGFNSFDYKNKGVKQLTTWVVKNARSGSTILLHDGYRKRTQTVKALPLIIKGIKAKGLGFSAICVNVHNK